MKLSTKSRYAMTSMMDLALRDRQGPVTLADIASAQGVSLSYLEQLFARLRSAGLVSGVRGPGGGYRLTRPAASISVAEIVDAVGESPAESAVSASRKLPDAELLWVQLSRDIHGFLAGISLERCLEEGEPQPEAKPSGSVKADRVAAQHAGSLERSLERCVRQPQAARCRPALGAAEP
jgi:Rrf2 family iron-sulfur cluster assembly transcriptional regulator